MDSRIVDLEIKVAFLENHIAELDAVVREVGERMELLRRELVELQAQTAGGGEKNTPESERPPHY